jgi:protein-tyrosine-phosphatase
MGIHAKEGQKASADSIMVCGEQCIDIADHASRSLDYAELSRTDYIFVMEDYQKQYVRMFVPDAFDRVFLLGAWPARERRGSEIPDPIGKGEAEYRNNFRNIANHIDRMLPYLLAETL